VTAPAGDTTRTRPSEAAKTVPAASTATPKSPEKPAPVPVPSAKAAAPEPASVVTSGRLAQPDVGVDDGDGVGDGERDGERDCDGERDGEREKETVGVCDGVGVGEGKGAPGAHERARTRLLPLSATTRLPLGSTARAAGLEKRAAAEPPSAKPALIEPATVVTAPAGDTARTKELSAT